MNREIDDAEAAAIIAGRALVEIRYLTRQTQPPDERANVDNLDRIGFLADLCHNLPGIAHQSGRNRAARKVRAMQWTWNTTGPEGQALMLGWIDQAGCRWTPPPPLPIPQKGPPRLPAWQRIGLPGTWPVRTPPGRAPLPRQARVLKALDTDAICAVYEEAGRLRLGLGKGAPWLRAHLDPRATHYLVPDPAPCYWPDPNGKICWWQCRALLRMTDGEQVSSTVAVLPETFAALPAHVPRSQQHRLLRLARATQRDTHLWGLDHQAECDPQRCGYTPPDAAAAGS